MGKDNKDAKMEIEEESKSKSSMGTLITAILGVILAIVAIILAIIAMSNIPDGFSWNGGYYSSGATGDLNSATKAFNILSYYNVAGTANVPVDISTWKGTSNSKRILRIVNTGLWNAAGNAQYQVIITGMSTSLTYNSGSTDIPTKATPTKIKLNAGDYAEFIQTTGAPIYIGMGLIGNTTTGSVFA